MLLLCFLCSTFTCAQAEISKSDSEIANFLLPLPRPISLQPYVDFWVQIYGVLDDGKAVVHDAQRTDKVYEIVDVPHGDGRAAKNRAVDPIIETYRSALLALADGESANNAYRKRAQQLWGEDAKPETLRAASKRLRYQPGHADEFRKSLRRAAKVQPFIRRALRQANIPLDLAALPHVESFFRNDETSSANAIGIWQFTPTIGRDYLRVDELIDERLDPRKSAIAAARLLVHNLEITGNWPMAVTAYNHGTTGILRAARQLGTPDMGAIARHYTGENFGFASRNFYAAVLAAVEVESNWKTYFGSINRPEAQRLSAYHAPANHSLPSLARALNVSLKKLQQRNPAMSQALLEGKQLLPTGYTFWISCGDCEDTTKTLKRLRSENPGSYRSVEIKSGDSLSIIAENNGFKTQELVLLNGLKSANQIRVGQKLNLPWPNTGVEPKGKQLAIPSELMTTLDLPLLSANEEAIYARLRRSDPYKPNSRFGYKSQLALYEKTRNKGLASLDASGTRYPATSQYAVDSNSAVILQPEETIDHLAQWLELNPNSLFLVNDLQQDAIQSIGQKITVIFDSINRAEFERRRKQYHQDKHRRFYDKQKISGETNHVIEEGDRIWQIATGRYGVPLWLLMDYNPELDFRTLRPGDEVLLPLLEKR